MAEAASSVLSKILEKGPPPCLEILKELIDLKVKSLSPHLLKIYEENLIVDQSKSVQIAVGSIKQSEKLWFDEREWRVTGSKCYGFYSYSYSKDPDWEKNKICV